ncbi:MAG: hypothetical protein GYB66_05865 [Chloroflexi bacterium]|nr:hypothetical protein [Chloroflexota bacterium]
MRSVLDGYTHHLLAAIAACFFALTLIYNWASPLFENSDEFFHFPLIKYLADNGLSLPVQDENDLQDWRQQGNQPPMYYMLGALLIQPFDTSDYGEVRYVNPHGQLGVAGESNINAVIHPLERSEEWEPGTALAVRTVRIFSAILATALVICTYYMTAYTFPMVPRYVGLIAAALVAFNPMMLFVGSSVNNDNLSNLMISMVLVLLVWLYRRPTRPPVATMLLVGVLLGISLLSKLSTGPFMLLVGLFWLFLAIKHTAWRYMIGWGFATLGIALLISGWWYIHNYRLYGDPTGLDMFLAIAGRRPIPLTAEQLWSERVGFMQSFWGLFGSLTVSMSRWIYTVFNILAGISIVGVLIFWIRRIRIAQVTSVRTSDRSTLQRWTERIDLPQVIVVIWIMLSGASLIRWTALTWASQGRLWFIALTSLASLSAVGFYTLGKHLKFPALPIVPIVFAFGVAVAAPFAFIRPAYAAPELLPRDEFGPAEMVFVDPATPDERLSLISAEFPDNVSTGGEPQIEMVLCAETDLSRDWSVFVHLVSPFDIILAQADFIPGQGAIPTSEVEAGQCWRNSHRLEISAGIASSDTSLDVLVGFYHATGTMERMHLADRAPDDTIYFLQQTQLEVGDELRRFRLGDAVRIHDYTLSEPVAEPGDTLSITLEWEVTAQLNDDYTVFVQILDPQTTYRAAASDKAPQPPTSAWEANDIITDKHTLMIDRDAPPGIYTVIVGLYNQPTPGVFERLRVSYDGVDTRFDALNLTRIRIE